MTPGAAQTPYVSDVDFTLYVGDVRDVLKTLPDESVDCVATSPPFYGLRDYGTGTWIAGDPQHAHDTIGARGGRGGSGTLDKRSADAMPSRVPVRECSCGARYHDPQIGLESSLAEWVTNLVAVFAECRRVLRSSGTLWVECGDSYNTATSTSRAASTLEGSHGYWQNPHIKHRIDAQGYKAKDLLGQPWELAFALRADGWWLRQSIIWHKPNAMPESATDRCTTAHSYVFLLSKSARYHFDADAIAEPAEWARWGDQTTPKYGDTETTTGWIQPKTKAEIREIARKATDSGGLRRGFRGEDDGDSAYIHQPQNMVNHGNRRTNGQKTRTDERRGFDNRLERADGMKNARSVWTIPTQGYPEAHFATWPEALAERIILAGCPKGGTVLDPFYGSGTTGVVARRLGRKVIGVELNEEYARLAVKRMETWWKSPRPVSRREDEAQQSLLADLVS